MGLWVKRRFYCKVFGFPAIGLKKLSWLLALCFMSYVTTPSIAQNVDGKNGGAPVPNQIKDFQNFLSTHPIKDSLYAITLLKLGAAIRYQSTDKSIQYEEESLQLSRELNNPKLQANARNALGISYAMQSRYAESVSVLEEAHLITLQNNFHVLRSTILNNLGIVFKRLGDFETSIAYYQKSWELSDSINYELGLIRSSNNLGNLYKNNGDVDQARLYFQKAIKGYSALGNEKGIASAQLNLALLEIDRKQFERAGELLDSASLYIDPQNLISEQTIVERGRGLIASNDGKIELAEKYFREAIFKAGKIKFYDAQLSLLMDLARLESKRKNVHLALNLGRSAQMLADTLGQVDNYVSVNLLLSELYRENENWEKAFEHYSNSKKWQDSINQKKAEDLFKSKQVQLEVAEKNRELELQNIQLDLVNSKLAAQNRLKWFLIILSVLGIIAGYSFYLRFRQKLLFSDQLAQQNTLITQQKQEIDEKNVLLTEKYNDRKKLDALKTQFFANVSHELRTPLNLILAPLQPRNGPIPQNEITLIRRNAKRLLRLVNQILDLTKIEVGLMQLNTQNIEVYGFIHGLADSFSLLADAKKIEYQIDIPERDYITYCDPDKLEKVVYNLLANAFKFTSEKGKVAIHLSHDQLKSLRISVSDSGVGIAKDQIPHIFDRFFQVDNLNPETYQGTGIGLSLTKELVELMGGKISVDSQKGKGSVFTVELPFQFNQQTKEGFLQIPRTQLEYPDELFATNLSDSVQVSSPDNPYLLVVEDNIEFSEYLKKSLAKRYNVITAKDGEEGLLLAQQNVPDLIISDVMMPKMNGLQLAEALQQNITTSHIPLILLTALEDQQTKISGFQGGADQFLTKPIELKELEVRLESVLTKRDILRKKYNESALMPLESIQPKDSNDEFLRHLIKIVEENLENEQFSVSDLHKEVTMSRMQLHRKLKSLLGQSASEFIRNIRLKKAYELLGIPGIQVQEVAYSVGFSHLSYFAKCFKEKFGVAPSDYLRK